VLKFKGVSQEITVMVDGKFENNNNSNEVGAES